MKRWPCVDMAMRSQSSRSAAADDLADGSPDGEQRFGATALPRSVDCAQPLDILAVVPHLLRLAQVELLDVARGPAVCDVNEHDRRSAIPRELPHVIQNPLVVAGVLDGNENAVVHVKPATGGTSVKSSHAFSAAITNATRYASTLSHVGFANSPIFTRSDVNITSGKTANESCRLSTTWLSTRSLAVPLSPYKMATMAAGTMAMPRVMRRRSHGRMPDVEEPFHHDLAGERSGERRVLTRRQQREREHDARRADAEQRRQQLVRVLNLGDLRVARAVERRRGDDEDRRVDEQRERERDRRIDERESHRLPLSLPASSYFRVCTIDECR